MRRVFAVVADASAAGAVDWSARRSYGRAGRSKFQFVGDQLGAFWSRVDHHALADGYIRKFGGLTVIGDIYGGGGELYFHGFPLLGFDHDRFRADFFDGADDVFFVAVREGGQREQD